MHNTFLAPRPIVGARAEQPLVALTFDDGPDPDGTTAVLDILARYGARATFFVLGRNAARHADLLHRIAAGGHQIANHTHEHPCLIGISPLRLAREMQRCERALRDARVKNRGRWMRPPFGAIDTRSCALVGLFGYRIVNWSVSGDDWTGSSAGAIAARILADLRPGAIVLLHDGLEPPVGGEWGDAGSALRDRRPTVEALGMVLAAAQARGYECVTVEALLRRAAPEEA